MTIDIERLKHDREYWDSVAPEGATHFQPDKGKSFSWYDIEKKKVFCNPGNRWIESWSPKEYWDSLIPRPSPTWNGEGLPPVGVECEIAMISAPVKSSLTSKRARILSLFTSASKKTTGAPIQQTSSAPSKPKRSGWWTIGWRRCLIR